MADTTLPAAGPRAALRSLWTTQRVWLVSALILAVLAVFAPAQAGESAVFTGAALLKTAPYLVLSIAIAAWAGATGADNLIAKAFTGAPLLMIVFGGLCILAAFAPFDDTLRFTTVGTLFGFTAGLWVSHLVQVLRRAIDASNAANRPQPE